MIDGQMIANFNTTPPPGIWIIWIWIGWAMAASAFLIIVHALLGDSVAVRWGMLRNAVQRAENAENEVIEKGHVIEKLRAEVVSLEGVNERLIDLARRKGFRFGADGGEPSDLERFRQREMDSEPLRPQYTPEERAEMWGTDGENDFSIDL